MKRVFKKNEKGFTLAELLIVVAIIAVLVAISIPIFTSQLEKARESTDVANIRAAYAEASVASLEADGGIASYTTEAKMQSNGAIEKITVEPIGDMTVTSVEKGKYATVSIDATGKATLSFVDTRP